MGCRNGGAGSSVQFTTLTFVFARKSLGATRSKEHRHWPLQFVLYHEDTTYLSFLFREIAQLTVAPHGRGKDCRRKEREIQLGEYPEQQGWRGAHQRISHPGINVKRRMAGSVCPIRLVGIGAPSNSIVSFNLVPLYGYITNLELYKVHFLAFAINNSTRLHTKQLHFKGSKGRKYFNSFWRASHNPVDVGRTDS